MSWPWLHIDTTADEPAYEQIVRQIFQAILRGDLKPGDSIPSERKLAEALTLSRGPVRQAYLAMETNGVIRTLQRRAPILSEESLSRAREHLHETQISHLVTKLISHAKELNIPLSKMKKILEDTWKAH